MSPQLTNRDYGYGPSAFEADQAGEFYAEEIGVQETTVDGAEYQETDGSDHTPVSNDRSENAGDEGFLSDVVGGIGGALGSFLGGETDSESALERDETDFESGTEWSPEDRYPQREADPMTEAMLDAYFAEAAAEEDVREFLPIFGLLVPVVKAALPVLIGALAKQGGKAAGGALQSRLRRLQQQRTLKKESGDESGSEASFSDSPLSSAETFTQLLSTIETVIGQDDRKQITKTNIVPWKRICHLRIRAANGQYFLGTGFFIGPRTIATAGHCVYLRDNGGWASQIQVTPGRNGSSQPFGSVSATSFRSVRGWVIGRKRICDYGVIMLPSDFRQPGIGAFGFAAHTDAMIRGSRLNLAGYPGDKAAGTMWYHGRAAKSISSNVITYDVDTGGGQSGSPVWQLRAGTRTVVGIHTNGSPGGNSATRITQPVFNNLMAWRQEGMAGQNVTAAGSVRATKSSRSTGRIVQGNGGMTAGFGRQADMEQSF